MNETLSTGQPTRLAPPHARPGAHLTDRGVQFALYSRHARDVDLVLFDREDARAPSQVIAMTPGERGLWHTFVPRAAPGQLYGYRVSGPWDPAHGHRFDGSRLLTDPYARAITGSYDLAGLSQTVSGAKQTPNYALAPKCVVVDEAFDWGDDRKPHIAWTDTVLYETHVKGLTAHPSSGVRLAGTYLGAIEKIPYLKKLGVTSIEFLPVHHCQPELQVLARGMTNYWGYMTLGFFAPDRRYSTKQTFDAQVREFKQMVKAFHQAGLEVILDVVYNHTCEGPVEGPTLCWRGIDNRTYYALADDMVRYRDTTGCGNSLDCGEPAVVQMIMDSLRYWLEVMHVDGFRFDLATTLGRQDRLFSPRANLLTAIYQDPVVSQAKLIAEPWDLGENLYQLGNFPEGFSEWNGRYRDVVRKHLKGDWDTAGEFMLRQLGSPDYFQRRQPTASVNFVTAHDGFTLRDVVSYFSKHNEANGEKNQDGESNNNSWNWGHEGETDDEDILGVRRRMMRNFMTCQLTAWGVPMLLGGDEFMRTQHGNNNAYLQDNDINWYDWRFSAEQDAMLSFVRHLLGLRRRFPHLRPASFHDRPDVEWLNAEASPLRTPEPNQRTMGLSMSGAAEGESDDERSDLLIWFHTDWKPIEVKLPRGQWERLVDTGLEPGDNPEPRTSTGHYPLTDRSVVMLRRKPDHA